MSLKPVTDRQRKLLALLGETPEEHQAQMQSIINKVHKTANSTKGLVNVHVLNKQVEAKLTHSEPTSAIVAKLEGTSHAAEDWLPDAYVLFIRKYKCRCGHAGSCLDKPQTFLRHRPARTRRISDKEHGPPNLYLPVKSLVHAHLPRLKEVTFHALTTCEVCFEKAKVEKSFSFDDRALMQFDDDGGNTAYYRAA